ncbi:MAG: SOS response-associated peptidase family protein [Balneola sp.]
MKRYVLHTEKEIIEENFSVTSSSESLFEPSYNVFPGSPMPVVFHDSEREIKSAVWGISSKKEKITSFSKNEVEENSIKGLELNPCIIPASGFYLWKQSVDDKYPFYIRMLGREVLGLAGLYQKIEDKNGKKSLEFAVISKASNVLLQPLEPTMPCILDPGNFEQWIKGNEKEVLQSQFQDTQLIPDLAVYRVPELVNDPSNNSKELIQAIPKLRDDD